MEQEEEKLRKIAQRKQKIIRKLRIHSNVFSNKIRPYKKIEYEKVEQNEEKLKNANFDLRKAEDRAFLDANFKYTEICAKMEAALLANLDPQTYPIKMPKSQSAHQRLRKCQDFYDCSILRPLEDESEGSQKGRKGLEKGLRKLAERSFLIMLELGQATYKQVAARLVSEFKELKNQEDQLQEESNIKRRVYDALNVLIALKVLKKRGRLIVYNPETMLRAPRRLVQKSSKIRNMSNSLAAKFQKIQQKTKVLKDLQMSYDKLKHLYARNRENSKGNREERKKIMYSHKNVLMGVLVSKKNIQADIELVKNRRQFRLNRKLSEVTFYGDLQLIKEHSTI